MTTEQKGQKNEHEAKCPAMDCCSPEKFAAMMAKCRDDMKCECGPMMLEMMKGEWCPPEQK